MAAIVGGAKVSTKLDLLGNLVKKVDILIIGGGMANTFLAAQGKAVGKSLCEHDLPTPRARSWPRPAPARSCCRSTPSVAKEFKAEAPLARRRRRCGRRRRDDPRHRPASRIANVTAVLDARQDAGLERPVRRLRAEALRRRHRGGGQGRGRADQGRQARHDRGRRRHGLGAERRRRRGRLHLHLDGRRRLPRMARRQGAAGRRGAAEA